MSGHKVDAVLFSGIPASLDGLAIAPKDADVIDSMLIEATAETETEPIVTV